MAAQIAKAQQINNGNAMPKNPAAQKKPTQDKSWADKAQDLAEIICSRESTYRTALDISAWSIPQLVAAAFRNFSRFSEKLVECSMDFVIITLAPTFTKHVSRLVGKYIVPKEEQKNIDHYMQFMMSELDSVADAKKALSRIYKEEVQDKEFLGNFFSNSPERAQSFAKEAQAIKDFCQNFEVTEEKLETIRKLKRSTILGESFVEGFEWVMARVVPKAFRKYVLKEDGFTGTKNYLNKEQSKKLGVQSSYSPQQILGTVISFIMAPLTNYFVLKGTANKDKVEKSPFWKSLRNQWDMTHGVYPKLGLLFSYVGIPSYLASFFTAQGRFELVEEIIKRAVLVPSWWLGHRATNGVLAKMADKKLAAKYKVDPGILVEKEELKNSMPEPAKIQHILDKTSANPELQKEARKEHSKVFYLGFALHSIAVFLLTMGVNYLTKLRVKKELAKS